MTATVTGSVLYCTPCSLDLNPSPDHTGGYLPSWLLEIGCQGNTCSHVTDLGPHPGVPAKIVTRPQLKLANTCTWKQHLWGREEAEIRMKGLSSKLLSRPFNHTQWRKVFLATVWHLPPWNLEQDK